jgi:hypothetical protein
MADTHTAELADFLDQAFRSHAVNVERDGDRLILAGTDMRIAGAIVSESAFPTHTTVQLDVRFEIGPGRTIVESCAGIGDSTKAAIENAERSFVTNALHVLLAAFARASGDQVTEERWESGGHAFRAILGNVTGRGAMPAVGAPTAWIEDVEAAVRVASLSKRTHWLRVYCARSGDSAHVTEALLDNESWPELEARLAAFPWPPTDAFYSARIFVVLDGGFDVSRGVAALHRLQDRSDADIVRDLVSQGASAADAERLVDFAPIAFGRPVLEKLGVRASDEGVIVGADGERTFRLVDDPIFADALALARAAYTQGSMPADVFKALALRGAELRAVNDALTAGSRKEDLALSPPRFSYS